MQWIEFISTIALRWMPQNRFDYVSILIQGIPWAIKQQAITWGNVDLDLYCHMESLDHISYPHAAKSTD